MKRFRTLLIVAALAAVPLWRLPLARAADAGWQGVDDKMEEIAKAAGHPAREPYINLIQGNLGLCMFLVAGTVGGFIAGYNFRKLFPSKKTLTKDYAPRP